MTYPVGPAFPPRLETLIEQSVARFRSQWPDVLQSWAESSGKIEAYRAEISTLVWEVYHYGRDEAVREQDA